MAIILEKRELTDVTCSSSMPHRSWRRTQQPGQFVILRVDPHGERVPISITDFDHEAGTVTLVVQQVGKTSGLICALDEGDEMLDFAGPLGLPAAAAGTGHAVLDRRRVWRGRRVPARARARLSAASGGRRSWARAPPSC